MYKDHIPLSNGLGGRTNLPKLNLLFNCTGLYGSLRNHPILFLAKTAPNIPPSANIPTSRHRHNATSARQRKTSTPLISCMISVLGQIERGHILHATLLNIRKMQISYCIYRRFQKKIKIGRFRGCFVFKRTSKLDRFEYGRVHR